MKDERRKSPRLKLDKPVAATVRAYISGQVLDVSSGGLLMRVRKKLAVGEAYAMRLAFPDGEVELRGTVRRCWLAGFETDEEADRVRAYYAGLEFERSVPELVGRFRPGDVLKVYLDPGLD
jgi:PilZ domain